MKSDNRFILIGKIVSVHGLHGNLKVYYYTESHLSFDQFDTVYLKRNGISATYSIKSVKSFKKNIILLSLEGVSDRDQSEALISSEIYVDKEWLPKPEEGEYYFHDLIGLHVYDEKDNFIGCVDSILETGSNDVYVVKNENDEILIPALESVVLSIELNNQRMIVTLPEGL